MLSLSLSLENVDTLESGGPVSLTLDARSAHVGRRSEMDWVLPDPSRHISGHHFDIEFRDNGFYLVDLSSNGTFLQGERYRIQSPHLVQEGDRFLVGQYIIQARLVERVAPAGQQFASPSAQDPFAQSDPQENVWGEVLGGGASGVQMPPSLSQAQPQETTGLQTPSFSGSSAGPQPPSGAPEPQFTPNGGLPPLATDHVSQPPSFADQAATGAQPGIDPAPFAPAAPPPAAVPPAAPPVAAPPSPVAAPLAPPAAPAPVAFEPQPYQGGPGAPPPQPFADPGAPPAVMPSPYGAAAPAVAPLAPPPQQPAPAQMSAEDLLQAFLQGAGDIDRSELKISPLELAFMLGQCVRLSTIELSQLLQDRAAVKLFVTGEDRTMRIATGNNPMKFMPDADRAFEAMFLNPRDGYMTGEKGFANALSDMRRHHNAIIAALQPALRDLLDGLSPEDIAEATGGRRSRKAWAEFEKRWEARAAQGENGILDAFSKAFSRYYSEAIREL